jgi:hypothetical protein
MGGAGFTVSSKLDNQDRKDLRSLVFSSRSKGIAMGGGHQIFPELQTGKSGWFAMYFLDCRSRNSSWFITYFLNLSLLADLISNIMSAGCVGSTSAERDLECLIPKFWIQGPSYSTMLVSQTRVRD